MGLELNVSNSLEELSKCIASNFRQQRPDVFQPYHIVTQTEGMNNWLKLQLASQNGIAANIRYMKPNDIVQRVYFLLGGKLNNSLSSSNIRWILFQLLGEEDFSKSFRHIAEYYELSSNAHVKRMALAEKLADLFDQYQVYRPDYIEQWNHSDANTGGEDWQQYLWVRMRELYRDRVNDKIEVSRYITETLNDPAAGEQLEARMPSLHIFGISITTPYHLKIFEALSRHIQICFYLLNPAPEQYWLDTINERQAGILLSRGKVRSTELSIGNNLLTSWGRIIKETFSLLFENDEYLNAYEPVEVREPTPNSLLHVIQNDIFHNRSNSDREKIDAARIADGSIVINSCYTIAREVESLYNYLVHLIDKKQEQLSPRDIVVMVSDINAYAPYIKAVFNNAPFSFSYSIADECVTNDDNIVNALKSILELDTEDFQAEAVVQLLDSSFIRRRFGLTNISLIREVVDRASIRFGIEGNPGDETVYVSWKYGLQRLIFGLCMHGEESFVSGGYTYYPVDAVEGSESSEIVRFAYFVEMLMNRIEQRAEERTISEWVEYIRGLVNDLIFPEGGSVNDDHLLLQDQLDGFNSMNEFFPGKISFEVFAHTLLQSISSATRSSVFASGGITFCSLIPMRSIPFKVVAMLGLNFDKFPRKETTYSFNLIERERRKGDRNLKDNDKHLFLETLLSAKEYLYISYIGQSVKDNTILPPSALVDELIDYIQAGADAFTDARKAIIIKQPLHSFSTRYLKGDPHLYNYLDQKPRLGLSFIREETEHQPLLQQEIPLKALIKFFKNPIEAYYKNVLDIRYDEESVLLEETEVFRLDQLQQWSLKHELLRVSDNEVMPLMHDLKRRGLMPLRNMSTVEVRGVERQIIELRKSFSKLTHGKSPASINIELPVGGYVLRGRIDEVYNNNAVFVCFSSRQTKYLIEAYLLYLAGRASGILNGAFFISTQHPEIITVREISELDAANRLERLIQFYVEGHTRMLRFYPDLNISIQEVASREESKRRKAIHDKFESFSFKCDDRYAMMEYEKGFFDEDGFWDEYLRVAEALLLPMQETFSEVGEVKVNDDYAD